MTDTTQATGPDPEFDFDEWCRDNLGAVVAAQRGGFITRCAVYVEYLDAEGHQSFVIGCLPDSTLMDSHGAAAFMERYLATMLNMHLSSQIMKNHLISMGVIDPQDDEDS